MRQVLRFDEEWLYHKAVPGEDQPDDRYGFMYVSAKTERIKTGPGAYRHHDSPNDWSFENEMSRERWEKVNLPHDYIIRQTPQEQCGPASGFFEYHNAWYRKHFTVDPQHKGKRISLLFNGVTGNSTVYLNGCLITRNHCSYSPFEADISDYVFFDKENVIAVHIDMSLIEGWWYRGAGIYRHVDMIITDRVCVDLYGDFIYPVPAQEPGVWNMPIVTTVRNDGYEAAEVRLVHHILDAQQNEKAVYEACGKVAAREKADIACTGQFENPELWDVDSPTLYTLYTEVIRDGAVIDAASTRFGFRTAVFDADKGLILNGRPVKIKGVCAHQDFGLTGIAMPDNIHRYRLSLIKEMGANGFRCSHYAHHPETMDALDELGFLVLGEIRHFDSNEDGMREIEMTIKRDRNRPSVIFWSTGNEELHYHTIEQGINIQRAMYAQARKFDPYRPITSAVGFPHKSIIFPYMDVVGANYSLHLLEGLREQWPDKCFVSTENCAVGSSYGSYFGDHPELGMRDARDGDTDAIHPGREKTWKFLMEREWIAGGYQWDAIEHRGEAAWPRLCSASGAIDLFLQKKDAFFQNQSLWTDEPMIHVLPHWNHHGFEGRTINVWAYTNCTETELFLNGKSLGRKVIGRLDHAEWDVPFEPGELKAVAYVDGKEAASCVHRTAGAAYALKLQPACAPFHAGCDMGLFTCTVVDRDGNPVPNAEPLVRFEADHGAEIAATGSANFDHNPVQCKQRRMFAGRITVGVKSAKAGKAALYAYADGLIPAVLDYEVLEKPFFDAIGSSLREKINAGHV